MVDEQKVKRFSFGENWLSFVDQIDQQRLDESLKSLQILFGLENFTGLTFVDIGSGSGIFSLAAIRLGAKVISIDFDLDSVECARKLRAEFGISQENWEIHQGSILDHVFLGDIEPVDLVYCWGVVHHTGKMREAIYNASSLVRKNGSLCLAIYNQQGGASRRWKLIKEIYNRLPRFLQPIYIVLVAGWYETFFALVRLIKFQNPLPFSDWKKNKRDRGMSPWHDWVDWIGGLPFEVAAPEDVLEQLRPNGFVLEKIKTVGGGWGCNEYLFTLRDD